MRFKHHTCNACELVSVSGPYDIWTCIRTLQNGMSSGTIYLRFGDYDRDNPNDACHTKRFCEWRLDIRQLVTDFIEEIYARG